MTKRAYLSIGTNLGDRFDNLARALDLLMRNPANQNLKVSPIYETEPVGGVKQDDFLNVAVALDTNLTPLELLHWLQIIEKSLHRRRLIHWGPRTIDLDIVLYEDEEWQTANLKIPHPEMGNRRFVLQPLLDVMDDDPAHQAWIKRLLQNTTDHNWIRPVE